MVQFSYWWHNNLLALSPVLPDLRTTETILWSNNEIDQYPYPAARCC
jgi:hypothetical protein